MLLSACWLTRDFRADDALSALQQAGESFLDISVESFDNAARDQPKPDSRARMSAV